MTYTDQDGDVMTVQSYNKRTVANREWYSLTVRLFEPPEYRKIVLDAHTGTIAFELALVKRRTTRQVFV